MKNDSADTLTRLLFAWRLWLAGAIVGTLLGAVAFALAPPAYRAEADVTVDHNLEAAWVYFTDRQLFSFLTRETEKLEAVAWSDETLQQIVDTVGDTSVAELQHVLQLSQPADGAWHFWATAATPARAEQLATAWAIAFEEQVIASIAPDTALETLRAVLNTAYAADEAPDPETLERYASEIRNAIPAAQGISTYLEVELTQSGAGSARPAVAQGVYLLVGSLAGFFIAGLLGLFLQKEARIAN